MYRAQGPLTQGPPVAPNQSAGSAGAGPCLPPLAQPPPPQAPVHWYLKYVNRPRGAPAAPRPPGSLLRCSLLPGPRGSRPPRSPSRLRARPSSPGVSPGPAAPPSHSGKARAFQAPRGFSLSGATDMLRRTPC
ncbi:hypothetical protein NDU88_003693 [Pleurodeles waltl]|uniref:Uncharacterized protein n=1 Tax=Pleurodeles waltl TaxID=8319 RepID=A0AAV7MVB5_PLEWA|nr:hypothetical protein NDU88_003693 [Pleurodeles waltl]